MREQEPSPFFFSHSLNSVRDSLNVMTFIGRNNPQEVLPGPWLMHAVLRFPPRRRCELLTVLSMHVQSRSHLSHLRSNFRRIFISIRCSISMFRNTRNLLGNTRCRGSGPLCRRPRCSVLLAHTRRKLNLGECLSELRNHPPVLRK